MIGEKLKTFKSITEFAVLFSVLFGLMRIEEVVRKITQYIPLTNKKESV
jgi:hypothetical protein